MNRKGFVFVETIIVIAIMLSSLMLIYSLYASSVSNENIRLRYDDTAKLYETFYLKKYLESFELDTLKARINAGEPYQMIYRGQGSTFGSSYGNEKNFFENLWMELHIENIFLFGSNISEIVECNRDDTAMICSNTSLLNYLKTLDDEDGYRLVIEYAMDESGNTCTSPIGCYYSYSSVKIQPFSYGKVVDDIIASKDDNNRCPDVNNEGIIENIKFEGNDWIVCTAPDNYGTSYYFRGNAQNNYVLFAGYYWRIIRVNGDGSTRMMYAGTTPNAMGNDAQIGTSYYNRNWQKDHNKTSSRAYLLDDNAGVGYMYGNANGIVETTLPILSEKHPATEARYYAKTYSYNEETGYFTLVDAVQVLGSELNDTYIGYYTFNSKYNATSSTLERVKEIVPSNGTSDAKIKSTKITYGTNSKENAQTNTNDSDIKDMLDTWYEENILNTANEQYVADTLFCNDRSIVYEPDETYTQLGYGFEYTDYKNTMRTDRFSLFCPQKNDRFTVNDEEVGNGALTYPIALATADEMYVAGGTNWSESKSYYLYSGVPFWSMTPAGVFGGWAFAVHFTHEDGTAWTSDHVANRYGVRPVINLKPGSLKVGNGTSDDPYRVS